MSFRIREWYEHIHGRPESGEPLLGAWITIAHPEVVEILSYLPFDWFVIDMEHAPIDVSQVTPLLMALKCSRVVPFVRVPWNDFVAIKRVLDLGVAGIVVPYVSSGEEARKAVEAVKYPPQGIRGVGPRRCVGYGFEDPATYLSDWNRYAMVIVQVETRRAVENVEEILSVDGITGVFVGPSDLSANLGMYGKINTPEFEEVLRMIAEKTRRFKKIAGIMAHTVDFAIKAWKMGYNFIALGHDTKYLIEGAKKYLEPFKRV